MWICKHYYRDNDNAVDITILETKFKMKSIELQPDI